VGKRWAQALELHPLSQPRGYGKARKLINTEQHVTKEEVHQLVADAGKDEGGMLEADRISGLGFKG
jgi:hypothetical protein